MSRYFIFANSSSVKGFKVSFPSELIGASELIPTIPFHSMDNFIWNPRFIDHFIFLIQDSSDDFLILKKHAQAQRSICQSSNGGSYLHTCAPAILCPVFEYKSYHFGSGLDSRVARRIAFCPRKSLPIISSS